MSHSHQNELDLRLTKKEQSRHKGRDTVDEDAAEYLYKREKELDGMPDVEAASEGVDEDVKGVTKPRDDPAGLLSVWAGRTPYFQSDHHQQQQQQQPPDMDDFPGLPQPSRPALLPKAVVKNLKETASQAASKVACMKQQQYFSKGTTNQSYEPDGSIRDKKCVRAVDDAKAANNEMTWGCNENANDGADGTWGTTFEEAAALVNGISPCCNWDAAVDVAEEVPSDTGYVEEAVPGDVKWDNRVEFILCVGRDWGDGPAKNEGAWGEGDCERGDEWVSHEPDAALQDFEVQVIEGESGSEEQQGCWGAPDHGSKISPHCGGRPSSQQAPAVATKPWKTGLSFRDVVGSALIPQPCFIQKQQMLGQRVSSCGQEDLGTAVLLDEEGFQKHDHLLQAESVPHQKCEDPDSSWRKLPDTSQQELEVDGDGFQRHDHLLDKSHECVNKPLTLKPHEAEWGHQDAGQEGSEVHTTTTNQVNKGDPSDKVWDPEVEHKTSPDSEWGATEPVEHITSPDSEWGATEPVEHITSPDSEWGAPEPVEHITSPDSEWGAPEPVEHITSPDSEWGAPEPVEHITSPDSEWGAPEPVEHITSPDSEWGAPEPVEHITSPDSEWGAPEPVEHALSHHQLPAAEVLIDAAEHGGVKAASITVLPTAAAHNNGLHVLLGAAAPVHALPRPPVTPCLQPPAILKPVVLKPLVISSAVPPLAGAAAAAATERCQQQMGMQYNVPTTQHKYTAIEQQKEPQDVEEEILDLPDLRQQQHQYCLQYQQIVAAQQQLLLQQQQSGFLLPALFPAVSRAFSHMQQQQPGSYMPHGLFPPYPYVHPQLVQQHLQHNLSSTMSGTVPMAMSSFLPQTPPPPTHSSNYHSQAPALHQQYQPKSDQRCSSKEQTYNQRHNGQYNQEALQYRGASLPDQQVQCEVKVMNHVSKPYHLQEVCKEDCHVGGLTLNHKGSYSVRKYGGSEENKQGSGIVNEVAKRSPPPGFDNKRPAGKYQPPHMKQRIGVARSGMPYIGQQMHDSIQKDSTSTYRRLGGVYGMGGDGSEQATGPWSDNRGEDGILARSVQSAHIYPIGRPPRPPRNDSGRKNHQPV
ncbi:hypothetical protein CEUSTIGMA_g7576.t1 [Chlamydomonas eustigma]|uniref:Uncharacterized protein n=1 Tax=Chlamydomonas eustigma TaxID=1157962 RepID=A0A250XAN1_9CHLO|nr:hypothetical protein CEUSTIGMA_g7576.t1 [Chlamydomonas eustigma]|eukprot:GAX80138.1 hypothetical protein CEUSTIGMA_g7576.t1 [Chlamydomonas eustigma]